MAKETFGQWLRRKRESVPLTQRELARRAGVSNNYISALEKDYSPSAKDLKPQPRKDKVDKIARALGASVSEARAAAGYTGPVVDQKEVAESEIAALFYDYKKLTPDDQKELQAIWEFLKSEISKRKR